MSIETAPFISSLNATLPLNTDPLSEADDHLRVIKAAVKASFPNINAAVTATPTQLNNVVTTLGGQSIAAYTTMSGANITTLNAGTATITNLSGTSANISGVTVLGNVTVTTLTGTTLSSTSYNGITGTFTGNVSGGALFEAGHRVVPPGTIIVWAGPDPISSPLLPAGVLSSVPAGWVLYSGDGTFPTYIYKT